MNMRFRLALLLLVLSCSFALGQDSLPPTATGSAPSLSEDQIRELIRQTADHDMENDKHQRDYIYIQREEQHKLDGKGRRAGIRLKLLSRGGHLRTEYVVQRYWSTIEKFFN